ncbi:MAG: hypothetical protein QM658_04690 [Gordonia sp. (in: high G+C Gram-positive bacteria)]
MTHSEGSRQVAQRPVPPELRRSAAALIVEGQAMNGEPIDERLLAMPGLRREDLPKKRPNGKIYRWWRRVSGLDF